MKMKFKLVVRVDGNVHKIIEKYVDYVLPLGVERERKTFVSIAGYPHQILRTEISLNPDYFVVVLESLNCSSEKQADKFIKTKLHDWVET